ncbi:MAG: ABC transporter ATP-binding protein [Bacteroidetes bacterium]|nr:MAG: ABC transporter ATP-binding protein [Bacteroidota bacterium]
MKEFRRLLSYIKPYKHYAFMNVVFNFLTIMFTIVSLGMIIPFLKLIVGVDELVVSAPAKFIFWNKDTWQPNLNYQISKMISEQGAEHVLILISVSIIGMFFLKNFFRYLAMYILAPLRNGVIRDIRNSIYSKLIRLPISFYANKKKGDIIARATNDVQDVEWTIMGSLEILFRDSITVIAFMTTLFIISTELTLIMLTVLPIAGFIIAKIGKSLRRKSLKAQTMNGVLLSYLDEAMGGLRIIKAFNAINYSENKFHNHNNEYSKVMIGVFRRGDLSAPLSEFFGIIVMSIVLWYGGKLILSKESLMDGATFIFYITLFSQVIPSVKSFSSGYYRIQKGISSAQRIWEIVDAKDTLTEKENAISKTDFNSSISYENLSFKYEDEYVLNEINLNIKKGKTIAIVGASGAGKSTLVDLLPRFYDPNSGSIKIDDTDIRDIKIKDLRSLMGIVNQESILFNDTIFNNIAFGMTDIKEEDVINAAKIANAHEFIKDLPEGYYTHIGDRGNKLSGGQKQRISIARAVLKNPPIMILDEATSALDTESERLVQNALENLMKNRTSIVIAHRLSTIKNADEIIVVDKGQIVEQGTHKELIELSGIYHKLHDLQSFAK